jgi:hypothetical protein
MASKKRGKDSRQDAAESAVTSSEPRIKLASESDAEPREPFPTLPEIDPKAAVVEADGYAHDTIPAPPLSEESDEEPDS